MRAMSPKHAFTVEVQPQYMPQESAPGQGIYRFAYTVTVTNTGAVAAQLVARHWVISDAQGHTQEVRGLGVVGRQPLLQPGESFQYTSGCPLRTPTGTMHGSYHCVGADGTPFEVPIALFLLEAAADGAPGAPRVLH